MRAMPDDDRKDSGSYSSSESDENTFACADDMAKMKVVYKVILFWNQESDIPNNYITAPGSHKNVVVQGNRFSLPDVPRDVQKALAALDVYKDTLSEVLSRQEQKCNEKFLKTVMLQVTRGVDHLHKCGKIFGKLTSDQVYICCCDSDEVSIVLHNPSAELETLCLHESDESGKQSDIKGLAKFFYELITRGRTADSEELQEDDINWSDNGVALHLLQMLNKTPMTVQQILDHPFFWTDNEKIDFICESFDRVKHLKQNKQKINDAADSSEVFRNDWISKLDLDKPEKTEIETRLRRKGETKASGNKKAKTQVNKKTIREQATGEHKRELIPLIYDKEKGLRKFNPSDIQDWQELEEKFQSRSTIPVEKIPTNEDGKCIGPILLSKSQEPYKQGSLYDLLRFFRNRRAHYWESKENVRNCLYPYPGGFWRFFSSRFPRLLPFVYDNRDECFQNNA